MRITTCALLIGLLAASPVLAAQKSVAIAVEREALKQMAAAIPLGAKVKLQTTSGKRMTATLMAVDGSGVIVKRASRVSEPAVTVPFDDLSRLERVDQNGFSLGKALAVGVAAGAGAILTIFAIAFSIDG